MRPNVVIFMTDQQRGATVLPGHRLKARTPHLDALAAEGVRLARSYTVSPHCCPSRASFLTGRYPSEHGVWNNVCVANALSRGPRDGTPFWSRALVEAGYRLGFAGKWHVSNTVGPSAYGWQELRVTGAGSWPTGSTPDEQRSAAIERERRMLAAGQERADRRQGSADRRQGSADRRTGEILRPGYPAYVHYTTNEDPFADAAVVDSAVAFVRDRAAGEEPWVAYVGPLGPHDPYQPPREYLDAYDLENLDLGASFADPMADKPALYRRIRGRFDQLTELEHREALRHYLAFCSYEDALFGRIRNAVAESGQAENTIFVYLSDHGDYAGDHGLWCKGLPPFDGAYHIPTIVGGRPIAERARGTTVHGMVSMVDFGPTLLELCGVAPPGPETAEAAADGMAGRSFAAALEGRPFAGRSEVFFQSNGNETYGNQRVVMTDDWKLVMNYFDFDELYDLRNDPDETRNLLRPAYDRDGGDTGRDGRRALGVEPLAEVPAELRPVVADLYDRLWRFGLEHDDDLTNGYIMTALASYGPGRSLGGERR